jgi:threonine synthase
MKLHRKGYYTCTNLDCPECLYSVANAPEKGRCINCGSSIGHISAELEGVLYKFAEVKKKLQQWRNNEILLLRDIPEASIEEPKTTSIEESINQLDHSPSFQYWKDTGRFPWESQ